jgi:hypothetical protein
VTAATSWDVETAPLRRGDPVRLLEPVRGWNDEVPDLEVAANVAGLVVLEPDEEDGWYSVEVPLSDGTPWCWVHATREQLEPMDELRLPRPPPDRLARPGPDPAPPRSRRARHDGSRRRPRRRGRLPQMRIETPDGRRFVVTRLGQGWICVPPGVEPDPNAAVPSLRDAIVLATGIGPEAPWVREQVLRIMHRAGLAPAGAGTPGG